MKKDRNFISSIKKSYTTNYYELNGSTDYGKIQRKVYLAIKGKIKKNPVLYLEVGKCNMVWHETNNSTIKKISRLKYKLKANKNNIARFYDSLPDNELLNHSKHIAPNINKNDTCMNSETENKETKKQSVSVKLKNIVNEDKFKNIKKIKKERGR